MPRIKLKEFKGNLLVDIANGMHLIHRAKDSIHIIVTTKSGLGSCISSFTMKVLCLVALHYEKKENRFIVYTNKGRTKASISTN